MNIRFISIILLVFVAFCGFIVYENNKSVPAASSQTTTQTINYCASNNVAQKVIVSIKKRHMWVCDGHKTVYNNPVVTGMQMYPADLTPTGTYKIYDKLTNQDLTGSDSTGSWNDPVSYWLPFLQNQYGTYGFHDATWRKNSDFGHISSNSKSASHGCVEMPLAAAKWLYNWAKIGTTVTIEA